jgi:hypothetical protein
LAIFKGSRAAIIWGILLCLLWPLFSMTCSAEELEPRRWAHLPIDTNFFGAGYAYTDADIDFDPVLKIEDGRADIHTWAVKYIRTFSLLGKSSRVDLLQGYQDGRWTGLLNGVQETVTRQGLTDSLVRFAINFYGAPPLKGKAFTDYRAAMEKQTIVGAGLSIQLPTGEYMDDKLINLGTHRYTFFPQVGMVHKSGKWSMEVTAMVAFFTDNDDFFNGQKLEQEPLYIIHGHLIYFFRPQVWASASAGYDYGGISTVDGVRKDDLRQDLGWALSFGFPVGRQVGIKLVYVGTRTLESTGTDSDTFSLMVSLSF